MSKKKIKKRHILKAISWRVLASLDTFFLSWIISNNLSIGIKVSLGEVITKIILYYIHEQWWFKRKVKNNNKRHILKTISWRTIGTIDTFFLSWIVSGNPFTGLKIGISEMFTKMVLYFFHEKLWYRINFGLQRK